MAYSPSASVTSWNWSPCAGDLDERALDRIAVVWSRTVPVMASRGVNGGGGSLKSSAGCVSPAVDGAGEVAHAAVREDPPDAPDVVAARAATRSACRIALRMSRYDGSSAEIDIARVIRLAASRWPNSVRRSHRVWAQTSPLAWTSGSPPTSREVAVGVAAAAPSNGRCSSCDRAPTAQSIAIGAERLEPGHEVLALSTWPDRSVSRTKSFVTR